MYFNRLYIYCATTLIAACGLSTPVSAQEVKIGALSVWGEQASINTWQSSIDRLNQAIPEHHFQLVDLKRPQLDEAVKNKSVEFIITNPMSYIELEHHYGVTRLLTAKRLREGVASTQFGAVIFARADRVDMDNIHDLYNRRFMGVAPEAFGGFAMAWLELKQNGIDPFTQFLSVEYSGLPQDKIVYAVRDGKVDAGTVRTDTLEHMAREGKIKLSDFRILNRKQHPEFPYAVSTDLYPEWPLASLAHTPSPLAKQVAIALLQLPDANPAAQKNGIAGWTVPMDYYKVEHLLKELHIGPYKQNSESADAISLFKRLWWLLPLITVLLFPPFMAYRRKLNNNIRKTKELARFEAEWSHALDFLDEPMYMVDLEDRIIRANRAFYTKIKSTPAEAIGRKVTEFTHPMGEKVPCKVCQARTEQRDCVITLELDDPANKMGKPTEISISVVRDDQGQAISIVQGMRDLTQIRAAETAIRESEARMRGLLEATPDPLLITNSQGTILMVNAQFERVLGYSNTEVLGKGVEMLLPETMRGGHKGLVEKYVMSPFNRPMGKGRELQCQHKDGHMLDIDISLSPVEIEGELLITAALRDITARKHAERELKRLASYPEQSPIPIIEVNPQGEINYLNPMAIRLFPQLQTLGTKHQILQDLKELLPQLKSEHHELIRNIEIDNAIYEQKITYDTENKLIHIYIWDVTHMRDMTRQMAYQAAHDPLTGLINRREFEVRLQAALDNHGHHVLCYMDLDQFKIVNDTCGHIAGDELLKQITSILRAKLRESDTLARLGGDEFGLLLGGCNIENATHIAQNLLTTVEDYRFTWDKKVFKIGVSIGIVPISEQGDSVTDILSAADTACYLAKEHGRSRYHVYNPHDESVNRHTSEMNWTHHIQDALDRNRFILYGQEILSLKKEKDCYYEVLIRMQGEDGNDIPPMAFLPAAERFGLIKSIDRWVITHALQVLKEPTFQHVRFSINLSGQSLGDRSTMNFVVQQITDTEINPERICFEITETAMIANLSAAMKFIETLRGLGCKFALDDFGSGFSSFAYLRNLPVDYIKIDGSFVRDMISNPMNAAMVESITQIGHKMGLTTVAEYVENEETIAALRIIGVDYAQGYGVNKPMPLDQIGAAGVVPMRVHG